MSPSARRTAPVACADAACRSGAPMALAISDNSAAAARALSRSPAASRISTAAASILARAARCPRVERERRGSTRPRHRSGPAQDEAATVLAAAFVRARSHACRPLQPWRTRPEVDGSRRGGRTPHPPPARGRQQLTRVLRVPCGIIPLAPQLHDFGAIEQALAAIAHEIGLRRHTTAQATSSTRTRAADRTSPDSASSTLQ